jgi:hypothetical protein
MSWSRIAIQARPMRVRKRLSAAKMVATASASVR